MFGRCIVFIGFLGLMVDWFIGEFASIFNNRPRCGEAVEMEIAGGVK
jgi:hypothetical protein